MIRVPAVLTSAVEMKRGDVMFRRLARLTIALSLGLIALMLAVSCTREKESVSGPPVSASKTIRVEGLEIEMVGFQLPQSGGAFFIGTYEITNAQYKAFLTATEYDGKDHPSSKEPFFHNWNKDPKHTKWMKSMSGSSVIGSYPEDQANYPACLLNWWHAKAFCDWLSAQTGDTVRLPTKEEWLFVAAGSEQRKYPWGDQWNPKWCNWAGDEDGFAGAAPVGSFPKGATPEGVHDLAGNIWEWCEDRSLRGGPWCMGPSIVTTSFASREDTDRADDKFGFRIVLIEDKDYD